MPGVPRKSLPDALGAYRGENHAYMLRQLLALQSVDTN